MDTMQVDQIQPGWDVLSRDGDKIGTTGESGARYITVRKGLLMPKDYYVPSSAIQEVVPDQGQVFLNCGKDEFDGMGWDQPPAGDQAYQTGTNDDTYENVGSTGSYETSSRQTGSTETQRVPRYEEELRAEKTAQQAGEVRVTKDVDEEQQQFDVPVTREDVNVRRVAVNRPAGENEAAFQEGEKIRVPVTEEQVRVTKEPRVVEEIEIEKRPVQEQRQVSDTVRRERVNVEQSGDVDVADDRQPALAGSADRTQSQRGWETDVDEAADDESDRDKNLNDPNSPF